jgi:flagellar assembly factor FliW
VTAPQPTHLAPRELELPAGLVGLPDAVRFRLESWGDDDSPFGLLQSLDDPDLAFVVVAPELFFPDYAPEVPDDVVAALELQEATDIALLAIVTVGDPVERSTANLLGPLVVDLATGRAAQAVLSPEEHEPRVPLLAASGG